MLNKHKRFINAGMRQAESVILASSGKMFDGTTGLKTSVGAGSSIDFMEHRSYAPGDDPRLLDWNVYARTEKLTLKMFHDEVEPKCDLLFDCSRSMDIPETRKAEAALEVFGFLAAAARNARFSITCRIAGDSPRKVGNIAGTPSSWDEIVFNGGSDSPGVFERSMLDLRRRGVRVLVSDLLWKCEPEPFIAKLAVNGTAVVIVQVLADLDINPRRAEMGTLRDSETGAEKKIFLDQTALDSYANALTTLRSLWERSCRAVGAVFISLNAERFLENNDYSVFLEQGVVS
ncbi:MAG: DUF58 domain-containing protein [Victivallales bacterium]|nr:DUF58 domain-containing protein [Victivallales bacterium]